MSIYNIKKYKKGTADMIEFPESRHLALQIKEQLKGKTVINAQANASPHKFAWFYGDPAEYNDKLSGKQITGTNAYGGMTEIVLDSGIGELHLVLFDGVNIRYYTPGEALPPKHQLSLLMDDSSSLIFSVQMYGGLLLMEAEAADNAYYISSKTKVSPVSEENTKEYFFGLMNGVKQNYSVKAFLATEQRFPGLGNGVLQDILFNAKIHPRRKLESLTLEEKEALYGSVKKTLSEMTASGGRDTEKDIYGQPGGYKTKLTAKTKNHLCHECGDMISGEAFLGGNVYFCPTCQRYEKTGK